MANIPIIAFSAWSGTGKTTVIEKLITELKKRGFKVAAVKHDAHDFEIDKEGKDSWRFTKAGADITVISSDRKTAFIYQQSLELADIATMIHDVDIIIAEGYNHLELPCIGISRAQTGKGFRLPTERYSALITDEMTSDPYSGIPVFGLDDIISVADFIEKTFIRKI